MAKKKQKPKKLTMSLQRQVKMLAAILLGLTRSHVTPLVDIKILESIAAGVQQEL